VRAAAGEHGVGGSEARRGGQRWRHTPSPVAGRGGAARRGVREQLGAAQAAPRAATTGSARAATRRPAQRGGQHWCRTPPPGAKCGGAAWRARAQGSCPPNWEREQKLAGDPSLPSSSIAAATAEAPKSSLSLGQRGEAVASREDGKGRRLPISSRKSR